jgi:hypothetical protein
MSVMGAVFEVRVDRFEVIEVYSDYSKKMDGDPPGYLGGGEERWLV